MKKTILSSIILFIIGFSLTSCKEVSDTAKEAENTDEKMREEAKDVLEDSENLTDDVPSFNNSAIQDYVNSYEAYLEEYAKAVENQDIDALSDLGPKGQELSVKAQEISDNISVEDAQKFTHYMTEKTKEIQELTLKMSK